MITAAQLDVLISRRITGPPPRVAHVATAVATAARRVAALAAQG